MGEGGLPLQGLTPWFKEFNHVGSGSWEMGAHAQSLPLLHGSCVQHSLQDDCWLALEISGTCKQPLI